MFIRYYGKDCYSTASKIFLALWRPPMVAPPSVVQGVSRYGATFDYGKMGDLNLKNLKSPKC